MATVSPSRPSVFNLPNQLTAARAVLAVVLFVLIAVHAWLWCLLVFTAAAITDWLDGYLARRQGLTSTLGRNLDPLVDKLLICGAYIFLLTHPDSGLVPWMATLVVARELTITSLRSFLENQGLRFGADWLGKVKMWLQCAALVAVFICLAAKDATVSTETLWGLYTTRDGLIYAMLAATALSGLQYLWKAAQLLKIEE